MKDDDDNTLGNLTLIEGGGTEADKTEQRPRLAFINPLDPESTVEMAFGYLHGERMAALFVAGEVAPSLMIPAEVFEIAHFAGWIDDEEGS